ncbi:hypothetical protein EKO27_g7406 [Xylaria grammica]|uniref:Cytochrome P450 n=1 Tax=Xylaria grammica TaxID=363999 RepID=A0A439CZS0_9PEZI|nr:hypothetical protein EKO27_g7406 [Xylaria grammica]
MLYMLYPLSFALLGLSFLLLRWLKFESLPTTVLTGLMGQVGRSRRFTLSTPDFVNEGYRKYSKGFARPFVLPTTWMRGGAVMVLPPSLVPLLTRPDKMSACEWRNIYGLVENIQLPYVVLDPNVYLNVLQFEPVRRKMQSRDMGHLAPITAEEIDEAFRGIWGTQTEWKTINGWEAALGNIAQLRHLALMALRAKYFQSRFVKEGTRAGGGGADPSMGSRQGRWSERAPSQLDARRIALRFVSLLIPLIFAICYVFAHCVFDILGSPARLDHKTGLASSEAINELFRVDSALRESMRMSGVFVTNLFRDVTTGELDIGNGIRVGPGIRTTFPTQNIHLDPDNYENPQEYDALRFSRPFEDAKGHVEERELVTTTTPTFLPFSYGRNACPGRWFAAQVIKQALAYIVQNYNVKLVREAVKRMALANAMVPPVNTQIKIQQKR